jgi:Domain of unknown function (DUF6532)
MQDHEAHTGLFENPCATHILRTQWFGDANDEGILFHVYFNPIPLPTLALMFTAMSEIACQGHTTNEAQVENCLDEWNDENFRSIDFTEKLYREMYESYVSNLEMLGNHPQGLHILARLQQRLHDKARYGSHHASGHASDSAP